MRNPICFFRTAVYTYMRARADRRSLILLSLVTVTRGEISLFVTLARERERIHTRTYTYTGDSRQSRPLGGVTIFPVAWKAGRGTRARHRPLLRAADVINGGFSPMSSLSSVDFTRGHD